MALSIPRPEAAPAASDRLAIFVPHGSDLLTDHHPHGDGLVAYEIASRLARAGHEVHVAAPRIDVAGAVPDGLRLYELRVPGETATAGRFRYMLAVRRLFERLRHERRIDVVHQLNPVFTGISLALSGTRIPVVLGSFVADWPPGSDPHAPSPSAGSRLARGAKRRIAWLQQKQASALLVTTPAARDRIVDLRRDGKKIVTLPHGIDPAQYAFAGLDRVPRTTVPTILFLGGIEQRKGIFTLLEAFPRVHAALPGCRLVVGGAGWEWGRMYETVQAMDERGQIELLGRVARADVPRLLAESTVFCMPSFGEPFGMSLLEAMACGKPVVATNVGGPGHLLDDQGGRKVPPGDAAALASALLEILRSPELQARMGAFNRAAIESVYSWDRVIARLEDVYRSVVRRSAVAG
ncbi:MAG TPA: glycosyltransferase family 4 protein [Candidatus Acidoferrum sp.]|nr:glycosyltransferase family 4 protein [Candidatus Acidoferrum sp.]